MNLNQMAADIHENAKSKGFYDEPPSFMDRIALMHSELSEAVEEFRDGHAPSDERYSAPRDSGGVGAGKPEGIPSEFADVIIRVLDACAYYGIDIERAVTEKHEYNKTRPVKHGRARL
jgi:NTP pyrophosphatase (non-canonical NTP hydrolase)